MDMGHCQIRTMLTEHREDDCSAQNGARLSGVKRRESRPAEPCEKVRVSIRLIEQPACVPDGEAHTRRREQQDRVAAAIEERIGAPLEVAWNITTANVISARVYPQQIPLIEAVEGVASVARETEHELQKTGPQVLGGRSGALD